MPSEFLISQHQPQKSRVPFNTVQEIRGTFQNANSNNSYGRKQGQGNKHANGATLVTYSQGGQSRSTAQNIKDVVGTGDAYKLHTAKLDELNPASTSRGQQGQNGNASHITATQQGTVSPPSTSFVLVSTNGQFKTPSVPPQLQVRTASKVTRCKSTKNPATSPKSPGSVCSARKELVEFIQSPRVPDRFDEEEDQEEAKAFWICDAEVYKKDQESRKANGQRNTIANKIPIQVQVPKGMHSQFRPMKTNTVVVQTGGKRIIQSAPVIVSMNQGKSTIAYKNTVSPANASATTAATTSRMNGGIVVTKQMQIKVNSGQQQIFMNTGSAKVLSNANGENLKQKPTLAKSSKQQDTEPMPQIVSCYSLKSNTASDRAESCTPASTNSNKSLSMSEAVKSTWRRKPDSVPPPSTEIDSPQSCHVVADTKQLRRPQSTSASYDISITKTIEKAKAIAEKNSAGEATTPSYQVKQQKRPSSASPSATSSTSFKTLRDRPRISSAEPTSKPSPPKKNARMSVKGTEKPRPSPSSSLESWFSSKQTTSLDMHVVGNYPSPLIISKKPLSKESPLMTEAKFASVPTTLTSRELKIISTSSVPAKLSSSSSGAVASTTQVIVQSRKSATVKTLSSSVGSNILLNDSQSKSPLKLDPSRGESQVQMVPLAQMKNLSQSPVATSEPAKARPNNKCSRLAAAVERINQTRSQNEPLPVTHAMKAPPSYAAALQGRNGQTPMPGPNSDKTLTNESLRKPPEPDSDQTAAEPPEEPLDYSMATLKKLEMGCFSPEQEFALDLSVSRKTPDVSPSQLLRENATSNSGSANSRLPEGIAALAFGNCASTPVSVSATPVSLLPAQDGPQLGMSNLETLCSVALSSYEEKLEEPKKSRRSSQTPKKKGKGIEKRRSRKKRPKPVKILSLLESTNSPPSLIADSKLEDSKNSSPENESAKSRPEKDIGCYLELTRSESSGNVTETTDTADEQVGPKEGYVKDKGRKSGKQRKNMESVATLLRERQADGRAYPEKSTEAEEIIGDVSKKEDESVTESKLIKSNIGVSCDTDDNSRKGEISEECEPCVNSEVKDSVARDRPAVGVSLEVTAGMSSVEVDLPEPVRDNMKGANDDTKSEKSNIATSGEEPRVETDNDAPKHRSNNLNLVSDVVVASTSTKDVLTKGPSETEAAQPNEEIRLEKAIAIEADSSQNGVYSVDEPDRNSEEIAETTTKSEIEEGEKTNEIATHGGSAVSTQPAASAGENNRAVAGKTVDGESPPTPTVEKTTGQGTSKVNVEEDGNLESTNAEISGISSQAVDATLQKNSLMDDISKGRSSPNVSLLRLNSDEMRTNFSVTSENQVINIRPESLKTIIKVKMQRAKVLAGSTGDGISGGIASETMDDSIDDKGDRSTEKTSKAVLTETTAELSDATAFMEVSEATAPQQVPAPDKIGSCVNVEVPTVVAKELEIAGERNKAGNRSKDPHVTTKQVAATDSDQITNQEEECEKLQERMSSGGDSQNVSGDKSSPTDYEDGDLVAKLIEDETEADEMDGLFFGVRTPSRKHFIRQKSLSESQEMLEMNEACCDEYDNMFLTEDESEEEAGNEDDLDSNKENNEVKEGTKEVSENEDGATAESTEEVDGTNTNVNSAEGMMEEVAKGPDVRSTSLKAAADKNESNIEESSPEQESEDQPPNDKPAGEENQKTESISPSDREEPNKQNINVVPVEVKEEWTDQSSTPSPSARISLKSPIHSNKKFGYGNSTPVRRIGYNFHADFSGCDIKIKRRKLVKKEEKPTEKKITKESPSPKSMSYILLSDSSDSSDEIDFIKTKVPQKRLKKRRKPFGLSPPAVREEQEPEKVAPSSEEAISTGTSPTPLKNLAKEQNHVTPKRGFATSFKEVADNEAVESETLQQNCDKVLRRSSRKRGVSPSRPPPTATAKVKRVAKTAASKKEVSTIQRVAGAIKSKYNKVTKKTARLKQGKSKTSKKSAVPKSLSGPETTSEALKALADPKTNLEGSTFFPESKANSKALESLSDPETNSEALDPFANNETKSDASKCPSSPVRKSVGRAENDPLQSTSVNNVAELRSRFHLSPSAYEAPSIHLNQSPPHSEDSDAPTPNIIRLKSFVRDPYSPECGEFGDAGDSCTTDDTSTVDKNVSKRKRSAVSFKEKVVSVPKRKPKFQILRLNPMKSVQIRTSGAQRRQTNISKKKQGCSGIQSVARPDTPDSFGDVSLKDVVDEIIRSSPIEPKTSVTKSSPSRSKKFKPPKRPRPRVSQLSRAPFFNLKSYAAKSSQRVHKNTARMKGNWKSTKLNDITKISTPPLTYVQPERFSKAKRDENIYLTMQKLLNMGLIMDQMPRKELPAVGWKSSFDTIARDHDDASALAANDYRRSLDLPWTPQTPLLKPATVERQDSWIKKEPELFAAVDFELKPCSVILKRLSQSEHQSFL